MKSILISIKPEWVEKILNGEKTVEIRKSIPKCELPCKVYIYCTKDKNNILAGTSLVNGSWKCWNSKKWNNQQKKDVALGKYNGKVVAEFTLNKYDLLVDYGSGIKYVDKDLYYLDVDYLRTNSCLTDEQIYLYLGLKKNKGYYNDGYVWHINELKIYDTPKELSEFKVYDKTYDNVGAFGWAFDEEEKYHSLKRPPQSWCYMEEKGEEV